MDYNYIWIWLAWGLGALLLLFIVISVLAVIMQNSMIYAGNLMSDPPDWKPEDFYFERGKTYKSFSFDVGDGVSIHCMFFRPTFAGKLRSEKSESWPVFRSKIPTVVWFHSNAGSIVERLPSIKHDTMRLLCNILIVDYRGYGQSTGKSDETGIKNDAKFIINQLDELSKPEKLDFDRSKVVVFGRSIGGAVAIYLATNAEVKDKVSGYIIENTFTSMKDLVSVLLPKVLRYLTIFLNSSWESELFLKHLGLKTPMLFLAAENDEMVPHSQMERLFQAATDAYEGSSDSLGVRMVKFPKGGHMDLPIHNENYFAEIQKWMFELFPDIAPIESLLPLPSQVIDKILEDPPKEEEGEGEEITETSEQPEQPEQTITQRHKQNNSSL